MTTTAQVEILQERIQILRAALVLEYQAGALRTQRAATAGLVAGAAIGVGIGCALGVYMARSTREGA